LTAVARLCVLCLALAPMACRGRATLAADASATGVPIEASTPSPIASATPDPTPTALPTSVPIEPAPLLADDRALDLDYSGGMRRPCDGRPGLVSPPQGHYHVDLVRQVVTLTTEFCGRKSSRSRPLPPGSRAKLAALVGSAGASPDSGWARTLDGPGYRLVLTRARGDFAIVVQGDDPWLQYTASNLADYLDTLLSR
jgi:hypothetical protein